MLQNPPPPVLVGILSKGILQAVTSTFGMAFACHNYKIPLPLYWSVDG